MSVFYRPHPKDLGRYCFQFVSSHFDGGGGGWEYPHPADGEGPGTPFLGQGTPIPGQDG